MNLVLGILKTIAINFAMKYAAELVVKHVIEAAEKAAAKTSTKIDDDVVAKLKADQQFIIATINGSIK